MAEFTKEWVVVENGFGNECGEYPSFTSEAKAVEYAVLRKEICRYRHLHVFMKVATIAQAPAAETEPREIVVLK